jgi:HAMP domain-containing protein
MKLLTKFNLVLVAFFGFSGFVISHLAYQFLMRNARDEVLQQAELMIASARSTREYTSEQVKPLILQHPDHETRFFPQTVPAFAATTLFNSVRTSYPDYSYREATPNPTNLNDRAEDWEADIVRYFADHPTEKKVVGERETPTGRYLYVANPMVATQSCLECHSTPEVAPKAMINAYGAQNGFGWKLNQVIAAQIVAVPMAVPIQVADNAYRGLVIFLVVTFVLTIVALDAALYFIIIRPLHCVSEAADRISRGDTDVPSLEVKGRDEIADVTTSFNLMRVSLEKALKMLEQ